MDKLWSCSIHLVMEVKMVHHVLLCAESVCMICVAVDDALHVQSSVETGRLRYRAHSGSQLDCSQSTIPSRSR